MATWKKVLVEGLDLTGSDVTNNEKDLVVGQGLSLNGTAGTSAASQETNNVMLGADSDVTIAIDIAGQTDLGSGVASGDLLLIADISDTNKVKRTSVSDIIAAVSTGVTTFNAGRNLTEADGDTDGVIDLNLDKDLVEVDSVKATEGSGTDASGTTLVVRGGAGTGTGVGGGIQFQVADASGTSGSTVNTYGTVLDFVSSGLATFYKGVVITDTDETVALNLNDQNIGNVGDIALDSISADGTTIAVNLTDNVAAALDIKQGANSYLKFTTTDAGETITMGTGVAGTAITIGNEVSEVTIGDNLTVTGDLTVNGATTTLDTTNLLVEDTFIALNSNGATNVDAGIVFTGQANKVFGWDQSQESGRFGVDYAGGDASVAGGGFSPDAWVSTVHTAAGDSTNATVALAQIGNIYINSSNQDIYIYS